MPSKSAKMEYRRRVKSSSCRGKSVRKCYATSGCKPASGTKRTFCRKKHNTKRLRRSLRLRK